MPFTPTAEQAAILEAFTAGHNLVVQAGAGTGKTTTLKLIAKSTPKRGSYIAFNRSIADSARLEMPNTVRALTAHSLAWQEYGRQFSDRMNAERTGWTPTIQFLNAQAMSFRLPDKSRRHLTAYHVARHAIETVKGFCQSNDTEITARHVPAIPGLDHQDFAARNLTGENHEILIDRVLPMARQAWADVQRTEGVIGYDHAFYLKGWALTNPTIGGDYLMFDEAQDATPVLAGVVNRQTHLQKILVGDSAQQIMAWAGAVDAMQKFSRQDDVVTLNLSESFRFGPAIAAPANVFLTQLRAPLRLTGSPTHTSAVASLDLPDLNSVSADAVLCRTNAGSLDEVIGLQQNKRKVCLIGGAVELRRFVDAAKELQDTGKTNFFSLMAFESWAQVEDHVANDPAGSELESMVELVNKYSVEVLLKALSACVPENRADVVVSTAHKAKGREWGTVRIASDFELDPEASPEQRDPELMLAYVAITRAKKVLDPGMLAVPLGLANLPVATEEVLASAGQPATQPASAPAAVSMETPPAPSATPTVTSPETDLPFGVPDDDVALGRFVPVSAETYEQLSKAAQVWGGSPEEFAARLLEGALRALTPPQ